MNFMQEVRRDIQDILDESKRVEPRLENPQAMVLVANNEMAAFVEICLGKDKAIAITSADKEFKRKMQDFTDGKKQIAVVCKMMTEGYDNPRVVLCVILRAVQRRGFFDQFTGRCSRIHRLLTGKEPDRSTGIILTYQHYNQRRMWEAMEQDMVMPSLPKEDPVGDDDDVIVYDVGDGSSLPPPSPVDGNGSNGSGVLQTD